MRLYRKEPEERWGTMRDDARLVQAMLAGTTLPDYAPAALAFRRGDTWTITPAEAEQVHSTGGAVIWAPDSGAATITTGDGA